MSPIVKRSFTYIVVFASITSLPAHAQSLTDADLKAAVSNIHSQTTSDFARIQGYTKLLKNPDLTDEQRATMLRYRASTRSANGDDKLGAVADYARIRDNFPNSRHYENAVSQYAYTYGQIYYMTQRSLKARVIDEDLIADIRGLGYWDQAVLLAKQHNTKIITDTPLLRDMYEAGYLCSINGTGQTTPRFSYSLDKQYSLDFCPEDTPLKYESPQTHAPENFGIAIVELNKKAGQERG